MINGSDDNFAVYLFGLNIAYDMFMMALMIMASELALNQTLLPSNNTYIFYNEYRFQCLERIDCSLIKTILTRCNEFVVSDRIVCCQAFSSSRRRCFAV